MTRLDEPLLSWNECIVGHPDSPEGVVVTVSHDADRLDVGLAVANTEWGAECVLEFDPGEVTVRKVWARLLTLREQWEWETEFGGREPGQTDPPEGWFPDESTPGWVEDPAGEQVWIAEWTS